MRAVNLLPRDLSQRRFALEYTSRTVGLAGLGAAVLICALLAFGYLGASGKAKDRQETLDALTAQLAATPRPVSAPPVDPALATDRSQRVSALNSALAQRIAWDRLLRRLSLVLPRDVWLSSFVANGPAAATAAAPVEGATEAVPAGGTCSLQGYAYSQTGVARLLARLAVVPALADVQLKSSAQTKVGLRSVYQFNIEATVVQGA